MTPSVTTVRISSVAIVLMLSVVLVERLDKHLDLKLLANPRERVRVSAMQQSKERSKRRSNRRKAHAKRRRK